MVSFEEILSRAHRNCKEQNKDLKCSVIIINYYIVIRAYYTGCPTRYRTRHFFNNFNTNEDIATKFEQEYFRCVRNEEECVCSAPNFLVVVKLLKKCRVR